MKVAKGAGVAVREARKDRIARQKSKKTFKKRKAANQRRL